MIVSSRSIKSLYPLALAEGEGVGTAYEYYVKRLLLTAFLRRMPSPRRILVAGLPEKYGSSLDFLLLAAELGAEVVVADHREAALAKSEKAVVAAQSLGFLAEVSPKYVQISDIGRVGEVDGRFDLALSCEVLQAIPVAERSLYWQQLQTAVAATAIFAPNAGNPAHSYLSGLRTIALTELKGLLPHSPSAQFGLLDLPPFPSGTTRTAAQREQATTGKLETFVMWGLNYYARLEKFFPIPLRRRYAHMVYGLVIG